MIKNFKCKETERIFGSEFSSKFPTNIQRKARMKLLILSQVSSIEELKIPPSNHLEKLKGDRKGQYSIRINKKWRICFKWNRSDVFNVEIIDYH